MHARNGKVARLPALIRSELNERLDDGADGPELLDWLNALPEVQSVLEKKFNGVPITKQNLSEWRQGGFQEWLLRRDLCADAQSLAEAADEMAQASPKAESVDNAAAVLAVRLGNLIARCDGDVDEKTEAKGRFFNGMCRSVERLQRSAHRSIQDRFKERVLLEEEQSRGKAAKRSKLLHPFIAPFQAAVLARELGDGEGAMAYARCATEILNDNVEGAIKFGTEAIKKNQDAQSHPVAPSPDELPAEAKKPEY